MFRSEPRFKTENPRVRGSIPRLGTKKELILKLVLFYILGNFSFPSI